MQLFNILLYQVGLFIIYMVVGFLLVKTKVLDAVTLETVSKVVLKCALPVLIFINTINGVVRQELLQSGLILLAAAIMYLLLWLVGHGVRKIFRLKGDHGRLYVALIMFGNVGFMGIPIVASIFPGTGMLYISIITILDQLLLWTVGVQLTTPSDSEAKRFQPKKLVSPATVAIVLAVVLVLCGVTLPAFLNEGLTKVGATATPLAMIYLGGVFACIDIRTFLKRIDLYGIVIAKMLIFPILLFLLLGLLPISQEIRLTVTMLSALPSMSSIAMLAKSSGGEGGDYAVGAIFVTTICSLITLPIVSLILTQLGA